MTKNRDKIVVYYDNKQRAIAKIKGREREIVVEYRDGKISEPHTNLTVQYHHVASMEEKVLFYFSVAEYYKQKYDVSEDYFHKELKEASRQIEELSESYKKASSEQIKSANTLIDKAAEVDKQIAEIKEQCKRLKMSLEDKMKENKEWKDFFFSFRVHRFFGYEILTRRAKKDED